MRNFYREQLFLAADGVSGTMRCYNAAGRETRPLQITLACADVQKHHLALMFLIISSTVSLS